MVAPSIAASISIPLDAFTVTAPLPETLSQNNVEAVTGIGARVFLQAIRAPGFPLGVMRLGKLRLVDRAAFVSWLRSQTAASVAPANDGHPEEVVVDVLGKLGLVPAKRRAGAGR
jgi:carbamoylphosphate synthase small subunit